MNESQHWNRLIAPDTPPSHAPLGGGFLLFRFVEIAAVAVLVAKPGTTLSYVLAAYAAVSIIINAVRWRTHRDVRVIDVHRWTVLRKLLRTDLVDAVSDEASQLNVDDRATFNRGVEAVKEHINRIVHVENAQAQQEIGWM